MIWRYVIPQSFVWPSPLDFSFLFPGMAVDQDVLIEGHIVEELHKASAQPLGQSAYLLLAFATFEPSVHLNNDGPQV